MIKEERHNQQYLIQTSNLNSREKCLDKLILGYGVSVAHKTLTLAD